MALDIVSTAQNLPSDSDSEEELSNEQVNQLLDEAERNLRAKEASFQSQAVASGTFKLPKFSSIKLDSYMKTKGSITRVDPSKIIDQEQRSLADQGVKKIVDPTQLAMRQEVSFLNPSVLTPTCV
jgi:hypothetical protein